MSNTRLDEISYKLGEVSASLRILASNFKKQDEKLNQLGDSVDEMKTQLKPVHDDVRWMKPQVQSYQKVRKSALWVGSAAVTLFGAAGGFISDWAFKKYIG